MCLGLARYFSTKTVESPNADSAILIPAEMASPRCRSSWTTCIPIPPPPALAFTITGYPISAATAEASSADFTPP
jgi:hypothetical protein